MTKQVANKPLQTHKLKVERWIPPTDEPFIRYTSSDEDWCRYFGIGQIVEEPAKYYDIRDEHTRLVGYTDLNPVEFIDRRGINLTVLPPQESQLTWLSNFDPPKFTEIWVGVRSFELFVSTNDGESCDRYIAWHCHSKDAAALAQSSWVKLFGCDNIQEWSRELKNRVLNDYMIQHQATRDFGRTSPFGTSPLPARITS